MLLMAPFQHTYIQRSSIQNRCKQLGVSLIELLTVISIVGIMAYAGVPQFTDIMAERNMGSAKTTLIQSLHKAKNIARAENTIVEFKIRNNVITLEPSNSSPKQTLKMPSQINSSDNVTFSFNAIGLIIDNNATTNVIIQSTLDNDITETITISTTGMIASL